MNGGDKTNGKRTALVTGASSGIGAATAVVLAERGFTVGIVARRSDRLEKVLESCTKHSPDSRMWVADLSDTDKAARTAIDAWDSFGQLDVLINNAGIPMRRKVQEVTLGEVHKVMNVNFFSPVAMTLAILPRMLERDSGCIVNVSSLGGRLGIATEPAYCASKFAMCGWSEAMAADLAATGVSVRLVLPGAIDTEIWDQPGNDPPIYDGPLEPAQDVAVGIADAIDGEKFEHYLPDMKAIVEMKTSDIETFFAGMREFSKAEDGGPGGSGQSAP